FIGLKILRPVRIGLVPKRGPGPDPFADHARPHVGDRLVDLPTDMLTKIHEERKRLGRDTLAFESRFQQSELKRRKAPRQRRHADERDGLELILHGSISETAPRHASGLNQVSALETACACPIESDATCAALSPGLPR